MNFGKKVHDRSTWCGGDEVLGSFRKIARSDEVVNSVRNGGLMGGCKILVNPTVKSGCHLVVGWLLRSTSRLSRQPRHHPYQQA